MKKCLFLKKTHIDITVYYVIIYLIIIVLLGMMLWRVQNFLDEFLVIFFSISFILFLSIKNEKSKGLYIKDKTIYYKNRKKLYIELEDIKGIKIIKAFSSGGKYRGFYPLKDSKTNPLYSAIFLSCVSNDMINYQKGDLWFNQRYKKHIICSTVYDKKVIDYLKSINENIELI